MAKGKVTLQMLSEMMANNSGRSKSSAESFVRTFFAVLKDALQRDNIVKVKGFGTFKLVVVSPRESINVNNGERVSIAGYNKITFTPDKMLKDRVNKAFAQFDTMVLEDDDLDIVTNAEKVEKAEPQVSAEPQTPVVPQEVAEPEAPAEEPASPVVEDEPRIVALKQETAPEPEPSTVEEKAEPDEQPAPTETSKEQQAKKRTLKIIGIVLFVVGVLLGFYAAISSGKQEPEPTNVNKADSVVMTPEQKAEQAALDSIAQLRAAAKDYEQVEGGDMLIAGTRTYRRITRSHNLVRYCMQIYGTKKVLPYVMKYNNLKSEYVPVGKDVKFPILIEKQDSIK